MKITEIESLNELQAPVRGCYTDDIDVAIERYKRLVGCEPKEGYHWKKYYLLVIEKVNNEC